MRFTFNCTNAGCKEPLDVSSDRVGKAIKCPNCGTRVVIPFTGIPQLEMPETPAPAPTAAPAQSPAPAPVPRAASSKALKGASASWTTVGSSGVSLPPVRQAREERGDAEEADGSHHAFLYGGLSVGGIAGVAILFLVLTRGSGHRPAPVANAPVAVSSVPTPSPEPAPSPTPSSESNSTPAPTPAPAPETKATPATKAPPANLPALSTEEIVARNEHGVAFIKGKFSSGTGFLVGRGILATNAHVLSTELVEDLTVSFPSATGADRQGHRAELIYEDSRRDLAFLLVPTTLTPLTMATGNAFRRGQDLVAIGCPSVGGNALQNAVSRGILSTEVTLNRNRFYQLDIGINPGNSGGPVINSAGHVLGIATLKARKEEHLAFCIPAGDVQTALDSLGSQPAERSAEVASMHRARVCGLFIARITHVYLAGMDIYAREAQRAAAGGKSPAEHVKQVADQLEPQLEAIRQKFVGNILPVLQSVEQDSNVPRSVRDQIGELWSNFNAAKQQVLYPRGSIESYRNRAEELRAVQERLLSSLQISLGIEIETEKP